MIALALSVFVFVLGYGLGEVDVEVETPSFAYVDVDVVARFGVRMFMRPFGRNSGMVFDFLFIDATLNNKTNKTFL